MYATEPEPLSFRRSVRRFVRAECLVVRTWDGSTVAERLLDVSTGGALVASDADVLPGDPLIFSFRVPGSSMWFDAEARVARIVCGRRPGDAGRAIGIAFVRTPTTCHLALEMELERVPPTIPQPRRPAPN